jgi:hypothetical protein
MTAQQAPYKAIAVLVVQFERVEGYQLHCTRQYMCATVLVSHICTNVQMCRTLEHVIRGTPYEQYCWHCYNSTVLLSCTGWISSSGVYIYI